MSGRHYEELWREGVEDLVGLLDAEHPEDRSAVPKKPEDWGRLYVRYVQTFRKLCAAHDGLAHPQKRASLRRTLEACLGRTLEIRGWLEELNSGVDVVDLKAQLEALKLTPDALDLPVPAYFREARAEALAARAAAAAAAERAAAAAGSEQDNAGYATEGREAVEAEAGEGQHDATTAEGGTALKAEARAKGSVAEEQERGCEGSSSVKQGREQGLPAAVAPAAISQPNSAAASPAASPAVPSAADQQELQAGGGQSQSQPAPRPPEDPMQAALRTAAAVMVQAGLRSWLARRALAQQRRQEMEFLGMALPADGRHSRGLGQRLAAVGVRRKQLQAERKAEAEEALVSIKAGVKQREGWSMKEGIRDKLSNWFLKGRDLETGQYPDLPDAAKGGSRSIVHPSPPDPTPEEAAAAAAAASKAGAGSSKGSGGKGAASSGPRMRAVFVEGLREAVQQYMDVWQEYEEVDPLLPLLPPELQDLPQPKPNLESYDASMITQEVRPVVFEEMRLEADEEMRRLIHNIKDMLKAEREGRKKKGGKKKGDKKGGGKEEGGKKKGAGKKGEADKDKKAGGKKGEKDDSGADGAALPKKKRKDLTAGRSIESIFAELACAGLVRSPAVASLDDFLGGERLAQEEPLPGAADADQQQANKPKTGGKKSNVAAKPPPGKGPPPAKGKGKGAEEAEGEEKKSYPEPSLAQARQAVVAACVLPLGAHGALAKLQAPRAALLYGPPGTGKSLLAQAVAHQAGATLFDLSPATTQGKYPGKAAAIMVNMVFKAARAMAPSVVLVEDADKVFVADKTRALALAPPGGELHNRIKKQLLAEVADLEPGDGVLVLCTSSQPQACVKKDERALRTFIERFIQLPLPDYGGRHLLLRSFAQREGLDLGATLSLLSQVTAGLSAGQLLALVQQLREARDKAAAAGALSSPAAAAGQAAGQAQHEVGAAGQEEQQPPPPQQQQKQQKQRRQRAVLPSLEDLSLQLLPAFAPFGKEERDALQEWTARVHSPLPPEEVPKDKKAAKKK